MAAIDLKRTDRAWYAAGTRPSIVDLPPLPYLTIDGQGDPNTAPAYGAAVETLYPVAYGIRRAVIEAIGDRYTVMPLEGLWWTPDMADFTTADKDAWHWTLLIRQPPSVTSELAEDVIADAGLERSGRHHEIYLSDPRRVAPEKLRTIIRQPVRAP